MPKFRKKPVVVEAFQIVTGYHEYLMGLGLMSRPGGTFPEWIREAWLKPSEEPGVLYRMYGELRIHTLEGPHTVDPGDWIIQGVAGELYPCKPHIFERTYEPVDEDHGDEKEPDLVTVGEAHDRLRAGG